MSYIDDVTRRAVEVGLMQEIDRLIFQLNGRNFNNIKSGAQRCGQGVQVFYRLGEAISEGEELLRKMRKCLNALQAAEPEHK